MAIIDATHWLIIVFFSILILIDFSVATLYFAIITQAAILIIITSLLPLAIVYFRHCHCIAIIDYAFVYIHCCCQFQLIFAFRFCQSLLIILRQLAFRCHMLPLRWFSHIIDAISWPLIDFHFRRFLSLITLFIRPLLSLRHYIGYAAAMPPLPCHCWWLLPLHRLHIDITPPFDFQSLIIFSFWLHRLRRRHCHWYAITASC